MRAPLRAPPHRRRIPRGVSVRVRIVGQATITRIRHSRETGCVKPHPSEAQTPEIVIPGATRPCRNCPLSLWERVGVRATPTAQAAIDPLSLRERVGVREPRGKQAGVNGNEWERQGYWGPSSTGVSSAQSLRPPSPRGRRGVGLGRVFGTRPSAKNVLVRSYSVTV